LGVNIGTLLVNSLISNDLIVPKPPFFAVN